MTKDLELEGKVRAWINNTPKFKRFAKNMEMCMKLYASHHKPLRVKDAIVDGEAELTLLVTKKYKPRTIKLCVKCHRKAGEKESEECGESEFEDLVSQSYDAGDETGEITISFPPWWDGDNDLEVEEIYKVTGTISEYKDKKQISPTEPPTIVEAGEVEATEGVERLKELMDMADGDVTVDMMMEAMQGYEGEVESAMKKLNLVEVDGVIKPAK